MDFRLRYVDAIPRSIIYSDRFRRNIPVHILRALQKFELKLRMGEDINPYQSKGMVANDFSGRNKVNRTDLLWADWKIQHFHLTEADPLPENYFTPRSGWQLFTIIEGPQCFFIDVLPHPKGAEYANRELLNTVKRCLPQYIDRFELKGILPGDDFTQQQHYKLRRAGVATPFYSDGKVYMGPGGGITTAGTALNVTMKGAKVRSLVDALASYVCSSDSDIQRHIIGQGINEPEFLLCLTPRGLAVLEKKSDHAFVLPRLNETQSSLLADLHDMLLPESIARFLSTAIGD